MEVPDQLISTLRDLCHPISTQMEALQQVVRGYVAKLSPSLEGNIDLWLVRNQNGHAKTLPLMDPFDVAVISLAYLSVLLVLGSVMKVLPSPKETALFKAFVRLHNLFLTLLSLYMVFEITRQAILSDYSIWFNNLDNTRGGWPMAKILWIFYVSKIYEFMDTIVMLLRKSFRQVTFLHVYHHCSIFPIWWLVVFMGPTGDSYFSAALNSFVHVVMYSYYLMATFHIIAPWKYYITIFQMLQFAINFLQAFALWYKKMPGYPVLLAQVLLFYMITLLVLFYNFYTTSKKAAQEKKRMEGKTQ
jgi:elongation of very long chain fatty acids protein 4